VAKVGVGDEDHAVAAARFDGEQQMPARPAAPVGRGCPPERPGLLAGWGEERLWMKHLKAAGWRETPRRATGTKQIDGWLLERGSGGRIDRPQADYTSHFVHTGRSSHAA